MLLADEDVGDGALVGDFFEGVLDGCPIICVPSPSVYTSTSPSLLCTTVIIGANKGWATHQLDLAR